MPKQKILAETETKVEVISSFYDLEKDNKLREIGDIFIVNKDRAERLTKLKLVVIVS